MTVMWKKGVPYVEVYEAGCKTFPCKVPFSRQVIKYSKSESLAGLDRGSCADSLTMSYSNECKVK